MTLTTDLRDATWLYDPEAVARAVEAKADPELWRDVVAALRLLTAARRVRGPEPTELLVAAMERISAARCALPDELDVPSLLLRRSTGPEDVARARVRVEEDAHWLHRALADPGEPARAEVADRLQSLAAQVLVLLDPR